MTTRKSLIILTQVKKEKEITENAFQQLSQSQHHIEVNLLSEKEKQYDTLKESFIDCQKEL